MRLYYIDGLKALGAFFVFWGHYNGLLHLIKLPHCMSFLNGEFAVVFFLMLSGFSIAMSLSKNDMQEKIQKMILGRYLRFALPMAIVTTVAYFLYLCGAYYVGDVANVLGQENGSKEYIAIGFHHYLAMLLWAPMSFNSLNTPLWMMKYIFEGTFAIIILHLGTKGLKHPKTLFVLIFAMMLSVMESIYLTDVIAGMLIYVVWNKKNKDFSKVPFKRVLALVLLGIAYYIAVTFRRNGVDGVSTQTQVFHLLGSICLIFSVLLSNILKKILSSKPFAFMGGISFEFYLIHWIIVCSFSSWLWLKCAPLNTPYLIWLNFILTLLVVTVLSFLMKKYAEPLICKPLETKMISKLIN